MTITKEQLVEFFRNFTNAKMSQVNACTKDHLIDVLKSKGAWDLFLDNQIRIQELIDLKSISFIK